MNLKIKLLKTVPWKRFLAILLYFRNIYQNALCVTNTNFIGKPKWPDEEFKGVEFKEAKGSVTDEDFLKPVLKFMRLRAKVLTKTRG